MKLEKERQQSLVRDAGSRLWKIETLGVSKVIESLEFPHRSVAVSTFETKHGRGGRAHGKIMKVVTSAVQKLLIFEFET